MPPPRPITWWNLGPDCVPRLNKSARVPAFIIGEDGNNLLMVTIPNVLQVPIFDVNCGEGDPSIEEQVQNFLEALLDAAKFETGTYDTEPEGAFYGLMRAHYRVRGEGDWVQVAELGIAYSEEVLTPRFGDDLLYTLEFHEMKPDECQHFGLPTLLEVQEPEPEVHRPTRFEREPVI